MRGDGLCRFEEETYIHKEGDEFWRSSYSSGLYKNVAEAERDAKATIPWLCDWQPG